MKVALQLIALMCFCNVVFAIAMLSKLDDLEYSFLVQHKAILQGRVELQDYILEEKEKEQWIKKSCLQP